MTSAASLSVPVAEVRVTQACQPECFPGGVHHVPDGEFNLKPPMASGPLKLGWASATSGLRSPEAGTKSRSGGTLCQTSI
jgi:hypothetical protein